MKKLALVLGTLLLAATASAKEVVAAPVVVEEVTVEEAVVVPTPEFKPTGYFKMENEWRGDAESKGTKKNRDNNYIYTEINSMLKFTEKDDFSIKTKTYEELNSSDADNENYLRIRYHHDFGYLGDSKVNMKSRLQAIKNDSDTNDSYLAGMMFNFVEYMPKGESFAFDDFTIMPKFAYIDGEDGNGSASDATAAGVEFFSFAGQDTKLGRIEYEFNVYYSYLDSSKGVNGIDPDDGNYMGADPKNKDPETYHTGHYTQIEAYIYHTSPALWTSVNGDYKVEFYQEGGIDPVHFGSNPDDADDTTVYYEPKIRLQQKLNAATNLTYAVGGYYCNSDSNDWNHTGDYEWEPRVGVTIKTTL